MAAAVTTCGARRLQMRLCLTVSSDGSFQRSAFSLQLAAFSTEG
jgi:hypothetical protein